jgi:hypothetical protein
MNNLNILALVYKYLSREFLPIVNQNVITIMKVYQEQNRFVTKRIAEFNINTLSFSVYTDRTFSKDDYSKIYRSLMRLKRALSSSRK